VKFEFLEDGTVDCPLIRLYGGSNEEMALLSRAIGELSAGTLLEVSLSFLTGYTPIGDVSVRLRKGDQDIGVEHVGDARHFSWILTASGWNSVRELLKPFERPEIWKKSGDVSYSFQWLAGPDSAIDLANINILVTTSPSGQW
jgi:hypothetical protein